MDKPIASTPATGAKEKIEKAHLQILKILRMEKQYRSAQKKIKSMLLKI